MKQFKLRIILGEEEYNTVVKPMYFDADLIGGFYVAEPEEIEGLEVEPLVVFVKGEFIPIMPDPGIKDYLKEKFVKPLKYIY